MKWLDCWQWFKDGHQMGVKVFKNEPSKICGRQPIKNLKWYGLPMTQILLLILTEFEWIA